MKVFFFLAVPRGLWDLSSPTRDGARYLGSESSRVLTTGTPGNSLGCGHLLGVGIRTRVSHLTSALAILVTVTMGKASPLSGPWFPHLCSEDGPFQLLQPDFFLLGEPLGAGRIVVLFPSLPKSYSGVCRAVCVYLIFYIWMWS